MVETIQAKELQSDADAAAAMQEVSSFLDAGDGRAAIAFAESLAGRDLLVLQVRAVAYTEGGELLQDRDVAQTGADLWRRFGEARPGAGARYNLANAEHAIWIAVSRSEGFVPALESVRSHLQ